MVKPTGGSETRSSRHGPAEGLAAFRWEEDSVSVLLVLLLFFEHLTFGANRADLAAAFSVCHALLLLLALMFPWGRAGLAALRGWKTAAALFILVVAAVLASLLPLPFGGHPQGGLFALRSSAAIYPFGVFLELAKLLGLACLFTLCGIIAQDRRRAYQLMGLLIVAAAAFALVCLVLNVLSPDAVLSWRKPLITRGRLSGLFSSPNTAATVFGINALLSIGGLLAASLASSGASPSPRGASDRNRAPSLWAKEAWALAKRAPLALLTFFLSLLCLAETGSRGGITAFAVGAAVLVVLRAREERRFDARLLGLIAVPVILAALLGAGGLLGRIKTAEYGHDLRFVWAALAWRIFTAAPILGFGLGSLPTLFQATETPETYHVVNWAGSAHNVYLQWLAEGGLLTAIPMGALMVFIMVTAASSGRPEGRAAVWRRVLICSALLVLVHSTLEYSLQEPSIAAYFSVVLGAAFGLSAALRPKGPRSSGRRSGRR